MRYNPLSMHGPDLGLENPAARFSLRCGSLVPTCRPGREAVLLGEASPPLGREVPSRARRGRRPPLLARRRAGRLRSSLAGLLLRLILVATALGAATPSLAGTVDTTVGVWLNPQEIAQLPMSGTAWNNVRTRAADPFDLGSDTRAPDYPNPWNQNSYAGTLALAKALVYARLMAADPEDPEAAQLREEVVQAIVAIMTLNPNDCGNFQPEDCNALGFSRKLASWVIAAELIGLGLRDGYVKFSFDSWLDWVVDFSSPNWDDAGCGAGRSLRVCHQKRPNNAGAMACASRVARAIYRGDFEDMDRAATVLRGFLGDRAAYNENGSGDPNDGEGFNYNVDLSWQCNESAPVGINPKDCVKEAIPGNPASAFSVDGVIPEDQRRGFCANEPGGSFPCGCPDSCLGDGQDPSAIENHVEGAIQGITSCIWMLRRQGYDAFEWSDRAMLRSMEWTYDVADLPIRDNAPGEWVVHLINYIYGVGFGAADDPLAENPPDGRNLGWADWTHGDHPCGEHANDTNFDSACGRPCGDVGGDESVRIDDVVFLHRALAGLGPGLAAPEMCNVIGTTDAADDDMDGVTNDCHQDDLMAIRSSLAGLEPGISEVCAPALP